MADYRNLNSEERSQLESQGCRATDWGLVTLAEPIDLSRLHGVSFLGEVQVGQLAGTVEAGAAEQPCGIYDSTIGNVVVGDGCLIKDAAHVSGYEIGDGAVIDSTGFVTAEAGSTFGCGTEVEAVNENGERIVKIYPELSSQVAYLMAMHRYRPALVEKLAGMVDQRTEEARADRGVIGAGATVRGVQTITNVNIGPSAVVDGAAVLENGTILSEGAAPTKVGSGVILREFIVAEATSVGDGAILEHAYIGQGCKVGKQFSGENCLLFANCEAFHGEGCAIFGGPYTVSHHKSTLLIGAQFSFYNAGSGTNQSNHMYKLGPVHQGIMERGCKTGSFSYLLWPCRLGPFSVVIGKNMTNFDLGDLPFSYITAEESKSYVIPAFNLFTVGTVRDDAKWRDRDRREPCSVKRDLIHFPTFSPYVVGRMLTAEESMTKLSKETDRSVKEVHYHGATIKRVLLRSGARWYQTGIYAYLAGAVFERASSALDLGLAGVQERLSPEADRSTDPQWLDISGMLVAGDRLRKLEEEIEAGEIADVLKLQERLAECHAAYETDEWNWVSAAWETRHGSKPCEMDGAALCAAAEDYLKARSKFLKSVRTDADKEFADLARIGFGADGSPEDRDVDFEAVRGTFETNKFVVGIDDELSALADQVAEFKTKAEALT